ncbi:hypothetical protein AB3N62_10970 [Leptospira sp. WS4.C2]
MKIKIILLFCISFSCSEITHEQQGKLKKVAAQKENITVIEMQYFVKKSQQDYENFRKNVIQIKNSISLYNPAVVFFQLNFKKDFGEGQKFARVLNEPTPTISILLLATERHSENLEDYMDENFPHTIKWKIKNEVSAEYFKYNGLQFPFPDIIKNSKAICACMFYENLKGEIVGIYPYHEYKNFLFEDCSTTITNEFLSQYDFKIEYDEKNEKYALYSSTATEHKLLKYINVTERKMDNFTPMINKQFKTFNESDLLENKLRIEPGGIFIVNSNIKIFRTSDKKSFTGGQVMAAQVYTLLDSLSK